jgi:Protein of unknown function (DUF3489)
VRPRYLDGCRSNSGLSAYLLRSVAESDAGADITEDQMAAHKRQSKSIKSKPVPRSSSQGVTASKTTLLGSVAKPPSAKASSAKVSKKEKVLGMLRESDGTSIAAIMAATGWQEHSVRGFFTAVVKKKLKLNLVSQKVGGDRVYRIGKTDPTA